MPTCCDSIENLGCYNFCDQIQTDLIASPANGGAGVYTIYQQDGNYKEVTYTLNQKIYFTNFFNEDMIVIFYIINPIGVRVLSGANDCFKVTINPGVAL